MKNLKFLVLEGDGIGPEIAKASTDVLKAALDKFDMSAELIYEDIGFVSLKKYKTTFREEILKIGEKCWMKVGPIKTMREKLNLYFHWIQKNGYRLIIM